MDFIECVKGRRSVRKYEQRELNDKILEEIIDVASYAPSWKNTQTTRYIVVQDRATYKQTCGRVCHGF